MVSPLVAVTKEVSQERSSQMVSPQIGDENYLVSSLLVISGSQSGGGVSIANVLQTRVLQMRTSELFAAKNSVRFF